MLKYNSWMNVYLSPDIGNRLWIYTSSPTFYILKIIWSQMPASYWKRIFPEFWYGSLDNMRLITSWVCHNFSRFGRRRVISVKIPHAGLVYQSLYYSGRLVFISQLTLILLLTIPGGLYLRPRSQSNCSSPSSNPGQLCSFWALVFYTKPVTQWPS